MSDYDRRQYDAMLELLRNYDGSAIGLRQLIAGLEGLVRCLRDTGGTHRNAIWEKLGDLEQVNAIMLDRGMDELDETGRMIVEKATNELVLMVDEAKGQRRSRDSLS